MGDFWLSGVRGSRLASPLEKEVTDSEHVCLGNGRPRWHAWCEPPDVVPLLLEVLHDFAVVRFSPPRHLSCPKLAHVLNCDRAQPPDVLVPLIWRRSQHPHIPTACGVRLEFCEILFFARKYKTTNHKPEPLRCTAPDTRTARACRSAIVARRSPIADRPSAVSLGLVRSFGRGRGWLRRLSCVHVCTRRKPDFHRSSFA